MQHLVGNPQADNADLVKDRRRAIAALDVAWGRRMFPGAPDADVLVALHKARYHMGEMAANLRAESARWLHARGIPDALGLPIDLTAIPTWGRVPNVAAA
jgi:hypothetical protein